MRRQQDVAGDRFQRRESAFEVRDRGWVRSAVRVAEAIRGDRSLAVGVDDV